MSNVGVRARCTVCGSTEKIAFEEIAGGDGTIKAEVLLVRKSGIRRGSFNPYLLGY
ncbi:MAG: hypothetical protein AB7S93_26735 [Xanthobacteraceae bacterium]